MKVHNLLHSYVIITDKNFFYYLRKTLIKFLVVGVMPPLPRGKSFLPDDCNLSTNLRQVARKAFSKFRIADF